MKRFVLLALCLGATPLAAQNHTWVSRSGLYEIFVQDFSGTGDFKGVTANLGRIAASGANVFWLMPVHPIGLLERKGTLGSPYAVQDYRAINPALGTPDDFKAMVRAAHARGLKVILDWVPNHTAADHAWVTQHPDWYFRDAQGRPSVPRDGSGNLTDWTDVRQLDYHNAELRREMIAIMQWWLDEYGLDGFRVDVAWGPPADFFREAITSLRRHTRRPLLFLAEAQETSLYDAGFDLTYPWPSYNRLKQVWRGMSADSFLRAEASDLAAAGGRGERLRFTTNHDETAWDNPPVTLFGGVPGARAAYVAMALLPGRPLLYNGQEVESAQKLRLFERDTIIWAQADTLGSRRFYHRVVELARSEPFVSGSFQPVTTSAPSDVIAYRRGSALILVNPRNHDVSFTVTGRVPTMDMLTRTRCRCSGTITLPAYGAMVLGR